MDKKTTFSRWDATRHRQQKTASATKTEYQQAEMKEIKPIEIFFSGKIQSRSYYNADEKRHRDPKEGPSHQGWYCNEQPAYEQYWVNGKLHRDPQEGPAYTEYDINGNIVCEFYYVDGQQVSGPNKEEEIKPIEEFYSDGKIKSRTYWNEEGDLHRDPKEGPAYQRWHKNGQIVRQEYWVDGDLHRDPKEGPAYATWYESGQIYSQLYYIGGAQVAAIKAEVKMKEVINPEETFYSDGKIQTRAYYNAEGDLHRDPKEGPALEVLYSNGQTYHQAYYLNGKLHRDPKEGPADEGWYNNGKIACQRYYVDGKCHRDPNEGPAYQFWHPNGQISIQDYHVDGKLVTKPKNEMEEKTIPTKEVADISGINNTENENYAKPITISIFIAAIISLLKNNKSKKVQEANILSEKEHCVHK